MLKHYLAIVIMVEWYTLPWRNLRKLSTFLKWYVPQAFDENMHVVPYTENLWNLRQKQFEYPMSLVHVAHGPTILSDTVSQAHLLTSLNFVFA